MNIDPNNPKVQVFFASLIGGYISIGIGYMVAWGWLPGITDVNSLTGFIAAGLASVVAPIVIALGNLLFFRVHKLVEYLGRLAEDPQSDVAGVVMRSDNAAMNILSEKVVGPSEAKDL